MEKPQLFRLLKRAKRFVFVWTSPFVCLAVWYISLPFGPFNHNAHQENVILKIHCIKNANEYTNHSSFHCVCFHHFHPLIMIFCLTCIYDFTTISISCRSIYLRISICLRGLCLCLCVLYCSQSKPSHHLKLGCVYYISLEFEEAFSNKTSMQFVQWINNIIIIDRKPTNQ